MSINPSRTFHFAPVNLKFLPSLVARSSAWCGVVLSAVAFLSLHADVSGQAVSTVTTVHTFGSSSQDPYPVYGVIRGRDGNFYGATPAGGTSGNGTVFWLTPDGQLTVLHNFSGDEPHAPTTGLVQGSDGNLYGTAVYGLVNTLYTTVFRTTLDGGTSNVHSFIAATEGSTFRIPLTSGSDGNLYGATSADGPAGSGTLFRLTPGGKVTILHSFTSAEGGSPTCPLAQGSDGNFYGTNGAGLFRITPGGDYTSLSTSGVQGGLVLGHDGNLYGTSTEGNRGCGSVVRVTPAGERTDIYDFFYADGYVTTTYYNLYATSGYVNNAPLAQGDDGNFYGTTTGGGTGNGGTVFRCTPGGELTVLSNFAGSESHAPGFGTFVDSDGTIYGLGVSGQSGSSIDTLFKVNVTETHPPFFVGETPLSNGVYYLNFTEIIFSKAHFGFYSYLSDPNYIYHFDLGYEYLFDAGDGQRGLYLYDFASQTFFYTSPVFPFPYLYDFSLNAVLYYYPDPNDPSRYNTNGTRYFYNYSTGQIITK